MQSLDAALLIDLARALEALGRARVVTQQQIARETGVDQPTISRAKRRELKRVTASVRKLKRYVDMRREADQVSERVLEAVRRFYGLGGSEAELIATIQHAASLVGRRSL